MPTKKKAPAKKKPATKKKSTAQKSAPASAKKEEARGGGMFWFALLVVVLAAFGAFTLRALPTPEVAEEPEVVEEVEEEVEEEVTAEALWNKYVEEGHPSVESASDELIAMLNELVRRDELRSVDSVKLGLVEEVRILSVPATDNSVSFCGPEGQHLCVLAHRTGINDVNYLAFFDGSGADVDHAVTNTVYIGDRQPMIDDDLHLVYASGQHFLVDLASGEKRLIGIETLTLDDSGNELWVIQRDDLTVTIAPKAEEAHYLLYASTDSTTVPMGGIDELLINWDLMEKRPGEIIVGLGDNGISLNRGGAGTFQAE